MLVLTSLATSIILPLLGCQHQAVTRVVVDDRATKPRTLESAKALAGVKDPEPAQEPLVALTAHRDNYADIDSRPDRLSVLSFNMHHRDRPNELAVMADRLRSDIAETPDFILLQEVVFGRSKQEGEENTAAVLANELDYYSRGTKRSSDHEGVAIISRYPFLYYAERQLQHQTSRLLLGFNRVSVMGEFKVPDIGRVRVVNVHFTNWGFEDRVRRGQLTETLQWVAERQRQEPADLIIFGGDFNIEAGWDELNLMHDAVATGGITYVSHNDPSTDTFGSTGNATKRVDYIFIAQPLHTTGLEYVDEKTLWANGIPLAGTKKRLQLSDHLPVLQEFELQQADAPAFANAEAP